MSFFLPGRLRCFLCAGTIAQRVDAAQLFYAHPDDVGDVATHGRAWVHRRCWCDWPLRGAWAQSAARLLVRHEGARTISAGLVVCRIDEREIVLQDTWQAIEASIPRDRLKDVLASIAATTSSQITWKGLRWTFAAGERGLEVTIEDEAERFEVFALDPETWRRPLEQIVATGGP